MGGAALCLWRVALGVSCFNRRGDSLGGAAPLPSPPLHQSSGFNRRGDSLGGAAHLPRGGLLLVAGFNRRGDSLGGAAPSSVTIISHPKWFQSQGRFFGGCCSERVYHCEACGLVSIAGAILWGVLPNFLEKLVCHFQFQSQGRFFGGCCSTAIATASSIVGFQSQGRFFGGCCCHKITVSQ